jgi:hypothetical protein
LYDVTGRVVAQDTENIALGANKFRLDLSNVQPGMYLLKCRMGEQMGIIKLIKE